MRTTASDTVGRSDSVSSNPGSQRGTPNGSGLGKDRWVVERTISWLHANRRLDRRYDRRDDIHEAFLTLGAALICHQQLES